MDSTALTSLKFKDFRGPRWEDFESLLKELNLQAGTASAPTRDVVAKEVKRDRETNSKEVGRNSTVTRLGKTLSRKGTQ